MMPGGRLNITWHDFMMYSLIEKKYIEGWWDTILRWICAWYIIPSSTKAIQRATKRFHLFERYMQRAHMFGYVTIEPNDPSVAKKWVHISITPAGYEFMEPTGFVIEYFKKNILFVIRSFK